MSTNINSVTPKYPEPNEVVDRPPTPAPFGSAFYTGSAEIRDINGLFLNLRISEPSSRTRNFSNSIFIHSDPNNRITRLINQINSSPVPSVSNYRTIMPISVPPYYPNQGNAIALSSPSLSSPEINFEKRFAEYSARNFIAPSPRESNHSRACSSASIPAPLQSPTSSLKEEPHSPRLATPIDVTGRVTDNIFWIELYFHAIGDLDPSHRELSEILTSEAKIILSHPEAQPSVRIVTRSTRELFMQVCMDICRIYPKITDRLEQVMESALESL